MKRFLRNCAALALVVAALLWLGGAAYRNTTVWKNLEYTEETEKYHSMPEEVTFAVFGPSHSRDAFQAADYGDRFFNFSMSSQTPQYDWMQMRQFAGRMMPGATVVLTASYLSPFWTDSEESFESKQERYYRFLSPENIVDCDLGHWCLERVSPLLVTDTADVFSAFLHPPELKSETVVSQGIQVLKSENLEGEQTRIRSDHLEKNIEVGMPDGNPVMLEAFGEMLEMCRRKGWNAVLVTPPYPAAYTECFPDEVLERFRELTGEISREFDVPWLDYSRDGEFTDNFAYFRNIDHLNPAGASAFSKRIQADLEELNFRTN